MSEDIPLPDSIRDEMERIYSEMSPADIPWNMDEPPQQLVDLVESGQVATCRTIDVGCGAGNYAVYLASKGFNVTGVDIALSAIALARENAKSATRTLRSAAPGRAGGRRLAPCCVSLRKRNSGSSTSRISPC